jgi:hypothetical protein
MQGGAEGVAPAARDPVRAGLDAGGAAPSTDQTHALFITSPSPPAPGTM